MLRPLGLLPIVGDGGFERYIVKALPELNNSLGAVHIAAERHAADKMLNAGLVHRPDDGCKLCFERNAAWVKLIIAPRQLLRPVACEAAAFAVFGHVTPSLSSALFAMMRKMSKSY